MTRPYLNYFFQIILLLVIDQSIASKKNHDQQNVKIESANNGPLLLNELLLDYDSLTRPASGADQLRVQISIRPTYVSWKDDQLKTLFTFEQSWTDERLKFMGETELKLLDDHPRLWLPDTTFQYAFENQKPNPGSITIQPRGSIVWTQQVLLTFPCPLDPNEIWTNDGTVKCTLSLTSRGFMDDELEYKWAPHSDRDQKSKIDFSNQLRKIEFLDKSDPPPEKLENKIAIEHFDPFNNSSAHNDTILLPLPSLQSIDTPVIKKQSELKILFTVQTEFTKSVLRYLTKKAMRDL